MPSADFRSSTVTGRAIRATDYLFGADPTESDLSQAARSDTLLEVFATMLQNGGSIAALTDAEQLALRTLITAALVDVNPTAAATVIATHANIDGTVYSFPDNVIDVTETGLPTIDDTNFNNIFIDHNTPRVWIGHRTIIARVGAMGSTNDYTNANYRGTFTHSGRPITC